MDTTAKFSGRAENYTLGRPAYSQEFVDSLYTQYGFSDKSVIADIGSGTGKFAKHLLDKGSTVIGVEPNDDMRNIAETELGSYEKFQSVKGTSDETGLGAESVDYITTAQAFHWFDAEKFRRECKRIIKHGGKVLLIWNVRDMTAPLNKEIYGIFDKYCPNFKGFSGGIKQNDERIIQFFNGEYEYISFNNPLYFDKDKFISRSLSGSYSLQRQDADYQEYLDTLINLFDKYSDNNVLEMKNKTVAYIGTL